MRWFYYLHTNGDLIGKNPTVVDGDASYFDSPFVKKYWEIETDERATLWTLILESLALGARVERIKELARKNKCDKADSIKMLIRIKPNGPMRKGITIFIKEILGEDVDQYWKDVLAQGKKEKEKKPYLLLQTVLEIISFWL